MNPSEITLANLTHTVWVGSGALLGCMAILYFFNKCRDAIAVKNLPATSAGTHDNAAGSSLCANGRQSALGAKCRPLSACLVCASKSYAFVKNRLLKVCVVPLCLCFLIFDGTNFTLCHLGNLAGQIANLCKQSLLFILDAEIREKQSRGSDTRREKQATQYPINRCHNNVTLMQPNEKS
jgi:hypothetical protein